MTCRCWKKYSDNGKEWFGFLVKDFFKTIYILEKILYSSAEQSRRPRVKCHRDGELPGGRRFCSRDGVTAPAVVYGIFPLLQQRYSVGRRVRLRRFAPFCCCLSPRVIRSLYSSLMLSHQGVFFVAIPHNCSFLSNCAAQSGFRSFWGISQFTRRNNQRRNHP